jgi:hypothetical protein
MPSAFFVILNELLGEEELLLLREFGVVKMLLVFICDWSNECAGFFTTFRMTYQACFFYSKQAFGRGRIPTVSAGVWSSENVFDIHV